MSSMILAPADDGLCVDFMRKTRGVGEIFVTNVAIVVIVISVASVKYCCVWCRSELPSNPV